MKEYVPATDDEGLMSVAADIFVLAFVSVTIVLISQHQYLSALSEAREVSFNAARAASQKIDEDSQRDETQASLYSMEATQAARQIVGDVDGVELKSVQVSGSTVQVVVIITVDGALGSRTFTGTARAAAIDPDQ